MPDEKAIRQKMKRKMQNHRSSIAKLLPTNYTMNMVDALVVKHFPNTPGAQGVQVEQAALDALEDMNECGEDLLVRLYNDLVPKGHVTLQLNGANDPRLVDCASE